MAVGASEIKIEFVDIDYFKRHPTHFCIDRVERKDGSGFWVLFTAYNVEPGTLRYLFDDEGFPITFSCHLDVGRWVEETTEGSHGLSLSDRVAAYYNSPDGSGPTWADDDVHEKTGHGIEKIYYLNSGNKPPRPHNGWTVGNPQKGWGSEFNKPVLTSPGLNTVWEATRLTYDRGDFTVCNAWGYPQVIQRF